MSRPPCEKLLIRATVAPGQRSSCSRRQAIAQSAPKTSGTDGTVRSAATGTDSGAIAHNAGATIGSHVP